MAPPIRYARSGDVTLAHQLLGDGPMDLVFAPPWIGNIELFWDEPSTVLHRAAGRVLAPPHVRQARHGQLRPGGAGDPGTPRGRPQRLISAVRDKPHDPFADINAERVVHNDARTTRATHPQLTESGSTP